MKSKKILFLSPYPIDRAPSQRLKFEQYYNCFEGNGFEIKTKSFVDERFWKILYHPGNLGLKILYTIIGYIKRVFQLFTLRKYDIVYVHLWVTPFGFPILETLVGWIAKKMIYDIDDMIFLGHKSEANEKIAWFKGKTKMIKLMKIANHVIVCTPALEEFVLKYNSNTTDISSTINTEEYQPVNCYNNSLPIVLGWSGSHSTSKYLHILDNVLLKLSQQMPLKLIVIGDASFSIKGIEIEAIDWELKREVEMLQKIDIGLYPLPNAEWVHGKSGLKALQYMALGIPTVATAIGANFRVIEHGKSGYLVSSEKDWTEALTKLVLNSELRKNIGLRGRQNVISTYSLDANKDKYLKVLNKLIKP